MKPWGPARPKMEPKIKKSRRFRKKIGKSDFPEKCTHYGGLTMFLGVPMVQKSVKITEIAKKRSKGRKNMPKKRIRKNDAKKRRKRARAGAHRGAPQIPCLSLPGLGKGGLGWAGLGCPPAQNPRLGAALRKCVFSLSFLLKSCFFDPSASRGLFRPPAPPKTSSWSHPANILEAS